MLDKPNRGDVMRLFVLAGLFAASTCYAQQATPNPPQAQAQTQGQAPSDSQDGTITIPIGTRIPLTLASPITTKTKQGDSVRAAVAFPVTIGSRVAIPVGTYVQGVITDIVKHSSSGPSVKMKFSSLVYANGYTVALDASNIQAKLTDPASEPTVAEASATDPTGYALSGKAAPAQGSQTPPTLAPPPNPGPNKAVFIGIGLGVAGAAVVTAIVLSHRAGPGPRGQILFQTGWQFDMVLNNPLIVNAASITPSSQTN
jgi:hypothetical protein